MWEDPLIQYAAMLRMRIPEPTADAVREQFPRMMAFRCSQPELDSYLLTILNKFEFNMWSGWFTKMTDEIDLETCLIQQTLLLRLMADEMIALVQDPLYRPDTAEKPPVSIIIPAWNQWEYTKQTLSTLFSKTVWPEYEVIVIDNASEDDTPHGLERFVREERRLCVIRNSQNLGFSGANNQGVETARHEHLMFLNNDMIIDHGDWIGQLMRSFLVHPRVGATGQFAVFDCFEGAREIFYQKIFFPGGTIPVSWISGYNLLTTKTALKDAGGWRGDLYGPAGYEDIHLGYALREAGWMCVSPREIPLIRHLIGKTRFTDAGKAFVEARAPVEDKYRIFCRHFGSRAMRQYRPAA